MILYFKCIIGALAVKAKHFFLVHITLQLPRGTYSQYWISLFATWKLCNFSVTHNDKIIIKLTNINFYDVGTYVM